MLQLLVNCLPCPPLPIIVASAAIGFSAYLWLELIHARRERDEWLDRYCKIASQLTKVKEALK